MLRSLITITWEKDLSKSSMRMHPHTARALRSLSTKLADRLPHIAAFALSTEKAVKTGEIRTEQTKTIELECAITLLVSLLSGENLKKSS
ncbi:hypothetical protein COU77_01660 [Candidatus Peregrinibacteria bacterium CG10_big_fil_rev_8_21_14_0_10_49_16]|nr:MAG: hypothetical protein COU77_01660 [Candidatus Peregrinibacteria bacterium CG10_big_fil_rev_8_21_14_0_10_49_16]